MHNSIFCYTFATSNKNKTFYSLNHFVIMVQNIIGFQGNPVVNQFVINTENAIYFQSYSSVVCRIDRQTNQVVLSSHWDYSTTTSKYLYKFLRDNGIYVYNKKDVLSKIKGKEFVEIENYSITLI